MAYKTEDIESKALAAIKKHKLTFFDDIVCFVECGKTTLYAHKVNESNVIKEALENNRLATKQKMRKRWQESDNATLQIGAYKLLASDDELSRLNKSEIKHDGGVKIETITGMIIKNES